MIRENKKRVLCAMSGGVDSSVAARLLLEEGYEVIGVTMVLLRNNQVKENAGEEELLRAYPEANDARQIARDLGIEHVVIDYRRVFNDRVVVPFCNSYVCGLTPNPCIECNKYLKFDALHTLRKELSCDYLATGHYAQIIYNSDSDKYELHRGFDPKKDQSYVLGRLTQEQLSMLYFPLFEIPKTEIRSQALQMRLPSAEMPESQEICFIPNDDYTSYIEAAIGAFPKGKFVDEGGNVLGEHEGIIHYTIGQRKGLGISLGHPVFVSAIDAASHTVTLSAEDAVFSDRLVCGSLNFMHLSPGNYNGIRADVKIRYSAHPEPATVRISGDWAEVIFDRPVRAVTPGQFAVFYQEDGISFAGVIDSSQ